MTFKVTVLPSCEVLQCVHTLFRSPRYLFLLTLLVLTLARDFTPLASLNGAKSRGKKKEKKKLGQLCRRRLKRCCVQVVQEKYSEN